MFVLTVDQRGSRASDDLIPAGIDHVTSLAQDALALAPDRTAGDEFQTLTTDPAVALALALALTRDEHWSVGLGVGDVETPLPTEARAARGDAFVHARDAVERAKASPTRIAVSAAAIPDAEDTEALVRLLVDLRDRRTPHGWEVADLAAEGLSQRSIAERLGITAPAVSMRARTAGLRLEEAAVPALVRLLGRLDRP